MLGGELQPTKQESQHVCKKRCFPRLKKVEKLMSTLKTLQDELRTELSEKAVVRIKLGLSEDVSVAPLSETINVKSLKKTLFPPNGSENLARFPQPVASIGYQAVRPSVSVRAFPIVWVYRSVDYFFFCTGILVC